MSKERTANEQRRSNGSETKAMSARHTHESTLEEEWPFDTDFNDHFETPKRAYRDVKPVLRAAGVCDAYMGVHGVETVNLPM